MLHGKILNRPWDPLHSFCQPAEKGVNSRDISIYGKIANMSDNNRNPEIFRGTTLKSGTVASEKESCCDYIILINHSQRFCCARVINLYEYDH